MANSLLLGSSRFLPGSAFALINKDPKPTVTQPVCSLHGCLSINHARQKPHIESMSVARTFQYFSYKKYLSLIHVFLPGAFYIEQLDSVPGKSGVCRFSPEKRLFQHIFRDFAMQLTWNGFLSYCLEMRRVISLIG